MAHDTEAVNKLVAKATDPKATSEEALDYSQAALNVAHALQAAVYTDLTLSAGRAIGSKPN